MLSLVVEVFIQTNCTCSIPMKPDWGRLIGDSSEGIMEDSSGGMIDKLNIQYMMDSMKGTEPV